MWPRRHADKVAVNYQWHFRSYLLIYGYINFKGFFFSEAPVICDPSAGSKLNIYCCVVMCALCVCIPAAVLAVVNKIYNQSVSRWIFKAI